MHRPYMFAAIRLANIVLTVILNVFFIVILKLGIEYVFISNLIASFVTLILLVPVIVSNIKFSLNIMLVKELLRFSLPYIPAGISSNIIQVINRPILTALTDDYTVGVFQANYRLGIFMMLFVSMFEFAWRPFFLNNAKEPDAKTLYSRVLTMFLVVSTVIFAFLTLFINDIVAIPMPGKGHLVGKAYWGGLQIVPVILLSYLIYGIYINLMAGIYIEKKTKYLPYITGIAAVINVSANFILIPMFGMMGSAIATLMSYIAMTAGIYFTSQKFYKIEYQTTKLLYIALILIITIILYYFTRRFDSLLIDTGCFIMILSSFFIFRIIDINTIKRFYK
jgi:O-antigen/teichoic acid export membrane protein